MTPLNIITLLIISLLIITTMTHLLKITIEDSQIMNTEIIKQIEELIRIENDQ